MKICHRQYTGFEPVQVMNLGLEGENCTTPPSSLIVEDCENDNQKNSFEYYVQFGCIQIGYRY